MAGMETTGVFVETVWHRQLFAERQVRRVSPFNADKYRSSWQNILRDSRDTQSGSGNDRQMRTC